jgi:hypothetical protein
MRAKTIAVETPKRSSPFAVSSGPSNRQAGVMTNVAVTERGIVHSGMIESDANSPHAINTAPHTAISSRCATNADSMAPATMPMSIQKPLPARPSLLSWRTIVMVALNGRAWMTIVPRIVTAPTAKGSNMEICLSCSIYRTALAALIAYCRWSTVKILRPYILTCTEVSSR